MRVLVTGASGMLGGRLASLLAAEVEVVGVCHRHAAPSGIETVRADLSAEGALVALVRATRPDAVLHAAADASVESCEAAPEAAARINVASCAALGSVAARDGIRVVALSTDLVFDGSSGPVRHLDPPGALNAYARTKLGGERALLRAHPAAAVARMALVVGRGYRRPTASESILRALREGRPLRLYTDQVRSPIDPESASRALLALLTSEGSGVYHLGGPERLSRHALGLRVAALHELPGEGITAVRQVDSPPAVPRPLDVSLDSSRARSELGWEPRPLDEALRECA